MEELFPEKNKLFAQSVQKMKGKQAKPPQAQQSICPKIPKRTQNLAARSEENDDPAKEADQLIDPQLAPCGAQGKEK